MPDLDRGPLLLAGDVGGTNVRLRLVPADDLRAGVRERVYRDTPVADALAAFVADLDRPVAAAGLGCAGRVIDGDVRMTNRPGESLTNEAVAAALGLAASRVVLVNDMVAHVSGLDECELLDLRPGEPEGEVEGIVMPGTGLGVGMRARAGDGWMPLASEGGHLDYGPPTPRLAGLRETWFRLRGGDRDGRSGRVTWENLCSGPALPVLYAHAAGGEPPPNPEHVTAPLAGRGNPGGLELDACRAAVTTFLTLTGARAGNLCLGVLATRAMTFGGGILNALYDADPHRVAATLRESFDACGPDVLRGTLRATPLRLLRTPDSGLIGAASLARARHAG